MDLIPVAIGEIFLLEEDEETNHSLWKAMRKIKRQIQFIAPIRKNNAPLVRDNEEIVLRSH